MILLQGETQLHSNLLYFDHGNERRSSILDKSGHGIWSSHMEFSCVKTYDIATMRDPAVLKPMTRQP